MSANPASSSDLYHFDQMARRTGPRQTNRPRDIGVPSAEPPASISGPSQETWGLHQNILKDYNDRAAKETDQTRKAAILAQSAEVHNAYLQGRPYPDFVQREQQQQQLQAGVGIAGMQAQAAGMKAGTPIAAAQARASGQVQAAQINTDGRVKVAEGTNASKEKIGFGGFASKEKVAQSGADAKVRAAQIIAASKAGGIMPDPEQLKWAKGIIEGGGSAPAASATTQPAASPSATPAPGAPTMPSTLAGSPSPNATATTAPGAPIVAATPNAGAPGESPSQSPISPVKPPAGVSGENSPFYVTPQEPSQAAPKPKADNGTLQQNVTIKADDGTAYNLSLTTNAAGKPEYIDQNGNRVPVTPDGILGITHGDKRYTADAAGKINDGRAVGTITEPARQAQQQAEGEKFRHEQDTNLAAWRDYRAKTGDTSISLNDFAKTVKPKIDADAKARNADPQYDAAMAEINGRPAQRQAQADQLNAKYGAQRDAIDAQYAARLAPLQAANAPQPSPAPAPPTASLAAPATAATAPQPGASVGAPGTTPAQPALAPLGVPTMSLPAQPTMSLPLQAPRFTPGQFEGTPTPQATSQPAAPVQLAVGQPHAGSTVVRVGTHANGMKVYQLQDGRVVDQNGTRIQ